jgi:hypothetical protein
MQQQTTKTSFFPREQRSSEGPLSAATVVVVATGEVSSTLTQTSEDGDEFARLCDDDTC